MLAQLSTRVKVLRPVSRNVFHPVPNVDSVLVGLERTAPPAPERLRAMVSAGFAHRRKALPKALAMAGHDREEIRERPVRIPDLFRTVAQLAGVDPDAQRETPQGRPVKVVEGGENIREIV